ncbi:hypothetical protein PCANC_28674 [Puccinia coronata f. sp. avenae]|uniref:Uncharacterized protein n=1 Tax=Puccinia coronata f. sp. avenae TaxID=200324 RepID=A0A2N5S444_9BASI|nr:hypothetical protein PCANC_28674 [Puccinia coronata f. sp. avenae]
MRPSDSNLGAGPPSESLTDSNSVALAFGHQTLDLFQGAKQHHIVGTRVLPS